MDWKKKIRAYGLKNAIAHDGKAQEGAIISSLFHEGLKKEDVKLVIKDVKSIISEINKLSLEQQNKEFEKLEKEVSERPEREGLPELDDVGKKGVIMRFSPSPSGPMHIGHVLTGMYSSLYVKKYGGKFYMRIEDTNPENIEPRAYKMLQEEGDWMFGNVAEYIIQSDRMKLYYEYIEKFFDKEAIYACTCDSEKFKELVDAGKPCPCRVLAKKENLARWKKMLDAKGYNEGEAVIRFRSDLNNPNPAMRDFPLARINLTEHPRQGKKYRVWPLMNLCVTVDDIEYKMTHIIRGKDHKDNAKRQEMMYNTLGLGKIYPKVYFMGRYNFTDLELSCSKTKKLIKEGKYSDWDDIRLPFVAALRKRGYQPEAFASLVSDNGLSEVDKVISQADFFQLVNNANREVIKEKSVKAEFFRDEKGKISVLMPDGSVVRGKSGVKPKDGDIVHFIGLGYCKYNSGEKIKFWFAHE